MRQVLVDKCNRLFRGARQERPNLRRVIEARSIDSRKAAGLDPGIWEPGEPVLAEKEQPSDSWRLTPLMFGGETKGAPCLGGQLSVRREELGSSSEVDGFRLQVRNRLLVERGSPVRRFNSSI